MKTSRNKELVVTMQDGSKWGIPVHVIANHRAQYYYETGEFSSVAKSLAEDTIPHFEDDEFNIIDWAQNDMDWEDIKLHARLAEAAPPINYEYGWINGEKEIVDAA
jgi:hypothetical protein